MMSAVSTSDLDLDLCAQEPIRIPGSIQPHGTLVVVDPNSRRIVQASANAKARGAVDQGAEFRFGFPREGVSVDG